MLLQLHPKACSLNRSQNRANSDVRFIPPSRKVQGVVGQTPPPVSVCDEVGIL